MWVQWGYYKDTAKQCVFWQLSFVGLARTFPPPKGHAETSICLTCDSRATAPLYRSEDDAPGDSIAFPRGTKYLTAWTLRRKFFSIFLALFVSYKYTPFHAPDLVDLGRHEYLQKAHIHMANLGRTTRLRYNKRGINIPMILVWVCRLPKRRKSSVKNTSKISRPLACARFRELFWANLDVKYLRFVTQPSWSWSSFYKIRCLLKAFYYHIVPYTTSYRPL